mgnify:CR=1 FL=1
MNGIQELQHAWSKLDESEMGVEGCLGDLRRVARTAWHPVSEPPTEADADEWGYVTFLVDGMVVTEPYWEMPGTAAEWARIRDVVLLPPEDE